MTRFLAKTWLDCGPSTSFHFGLCRIGTSLWVGNPNGASPYFIWVRFSFSFPNELKWQLSLLIHHSSFWTIGIRDSRTLLAQPKQFFPSSVSMANIWASTSFAWFVKKIRFLMLISKLHVSSSSQLGIDFGSVVLDDILVEMVNPQIILMWFLFLGAVSSKTFLNASKSGIIKSDAMVFPDYLACVS